MNDHFPRVIFVTGTGTGVGKTIVSAVLAEALYADYWKPVQAGYDDGTDSEWVAGAISNSRTIIHPETYKLKMAASPHIAARSENITISIDNIIGSFPHTANRLIIEGAGGLMVPLNDNQFVADLVSALNVPVFLVSRNVLGSINHSLLTASVCKQRDIKVLAWIFNDTYLDYQNDIQRWTNIPALTTVPHTSLPGKQFILEQAAAIRNKLTTAIW